MIVFTREPSYLACYDDIIIKGNLLKFDAIDVICLIPIVCSVYDLNRMQ